MTNYASVDDDALVLVRELPGPIERVWAFLTDPTLLSRWFSGGVMEGHAGGEVRFEMGADGQVTVFEPPHVLEYTWNERERSLGDIFDSIVRWELHESGERVKLTLTHKRLTKLEAVRHSAGWHAFLDRLASVAEGIEPPDLMARFLQLRDEYGKLHGLELGGAA